MGDGPSILPATGRTVDMSDPQKGQEYVPHTTMSHKLLEMDGQTSARHAFVVIRIANRFSSKRRSWQIRKGGGQKKEKRKNTSSPLSQPRVPGDNFTRSSLREKKGGINELQITAHTLSCKDEGFIRIFEITKTPNF